MEREVMAEFRKIREELAQLRAGLEMFARSLRSAASWGYDWTNGNSDVNRAKQQALEEVATAIDMAFNLDSKRKVAP